MRSFLVLALVGSLGFLAGCGSSGTPAGIAITISLSPSSASVNAGGVVNIVATVANDSSNAGVSWSLSGVGALSAQTTTSVTYTAPATVTTTSVATVVATSKASSSVTASLPITVSPAGTIANVVPISVNGGPLPTTNPPIYANGAFASVQICAPCTCACQTIDNVLVDTGSFGLRLLGSQVTISARSPSLTAAATHCITAFNFRTIRFCGELWRRQISCWAERRQLRLPFRSSRIQVLAYQADAPELTKIRSSFGRKRHTGRRPRTVRLRRGLRPSSEPRGHTPADILLCSSGGPATRHLYPVARFARGRRLINK